MESSIVILLLIANASIGVARRRAEDGMRTRSRNRPPPTWTSAPALWRTEKRILSVIEEARNSGGVYLEVPVTGGRRLRLLTEAAGAKHVVEIGTSTGLLRLMGVSRCRARAGS